MSILNLRKIYHANVVAEVASFSRASEILHLSQPALTRSIQSLERELGVRLFERSRLGVCTTPEGELILHRCRNLLLQADFLQQEAKLIRSAELGQVHFGIGPLIAEIVLPGLLTAVCSRNSEVSVKVEIDSPQYLLEALLKQNIEFFISATHIFSRPVETGIQIQPIRQMDFGFFVRQGHPLAAWREIHEDDLLPYHILSPDPGTEAGMFFKQIFGEDSASHRFQWIMANDNRTLKTITLGSDAVLLTLRETARRELDNGTLEELDIRPLSEESAWKIGIVSLAGRRHSVISRMLHKQIYAILNPDGPQD